VRLNPAGFQGTPEPKDEPSAENPPRGAVLDYFLRAPSASPISIEILDAGGAVLRRYASDDKVAPPDLQQIQVTEDWVPAPEPPPATAGMHRFVWDLHYAAPKDLSRSRRSSAGVWAPPGRYAVRLTAGGRTLTQALVVRRDPRVPASDEDLVHQCELARRIEAERVRIAVALGSAGELRKQTSALEGKAAGEAAAALADFRGKLDEAAGPAIRPEEFYDVSQAAPTSLLRLAVSLARLQGAVESADAAPTTDAVAGFGQRQEAVEQGLARWKDFLRTGIPKVNSALAAASLTPIRPE
jgi:hypothetical protein